MNSFYGKIKLLVFFPIFFSPFKPFLDFYKRFKTKISKIGPDVLEF